MAVRWRARAERLWRPPNRQTSKLTAVVPRPRVAGRRRLKDTRPFVIDRLRHHLFALKSSQLLQELLVKVLELLVRFSASAVRCPSLRKASIAMRWRANAVSSRVAPPEAILTSWASG
jgi:hypothetical protein